MKKEEHRKAVALRYDAAKDAAPTVVAKGQRLIADRIIALAREHGVHIHEDPDLVGLLSNLDLNMQIPESLYQAVAEVLAFLYRLTQQMGKRPPAPARR